MFIRIDFPQVAIVALWIATAQSMVAQDPNGAHTQAAPKGVTELKESLAANQSKLKAYQWSQTTVVSIKGKTRKDEQAQCRYGPGPRRTLPWCNDGT